MVGANGGARLTETGYPADAIDDGFLDELHQRAMDLDGDIAGALRLARDLGRSAPAPGSGGTARLFEILATLAAADLTVARVVEPHLDALAVLLQFGADAESRLGVVGASADSSWGVFAAEARGMRVDAVERDGRWTLTGTKPWCSLASELSHALVTAHTGPGSRRLFAVDLRGHQVEVLPDRWFARGLTSVRSGPVEFTGAPAAPIGEDGWYLARPGFTWGAIGVAAVWWGGALGVARRTAEWAGQRAGEATAAGHPPDSIAMMHLGVTDIEVEVGRLALRRAAESIDRGAADRRGSRILAQRTRSTVVRAAEEILRSSKHAMGPAPLALEDRHARRVADLELYLRQDHAESDEAALGRALVDGGGPRW